MLVDLEMERKRRLGEVLKLILTLTKREEEVARHHVVEVVPYLDDICAS